MRTNFIIVLLCLVGLGYYAYKHIDWNAPKEKQISFVQVQGQTIALENVKAVQIPQQVYDSMADNPQWKEYLLGDKKRVLLVTWDGCPYERAFKRAVQKIFTFKNITNYYTSSIVNTGQSISVRCAGDLAQSCPMMWIMDHCVPGICIINPKTHEAIAAKSHNASQIAPLLSAYATWDDTPLFSTER